MGQHFNNFRTHVQDQPYLGVRYIHTENASGGVEEVSLLRFPVCPFGNKCCVPYIYCQDNNRIVEACKGSPLDPKNRFQSSTCLLNLTF